MFSVEWLAMSDTWFTCEIMAKGYWRLPDKSCLDWGWGRNIRITSQVVFCALVLNNFYRRIRKGYKQRGLCFYLQGIVLENERSISLLLYAFCLVWFFFFASGMHVLKVKRLWRNLCVQAEIFLKELRGWFLLFVFFSLFSYWPWEYMYFTKCS